MTERGRWGLATCVGLALHLLPLAVRFPPSERSPRELVRFEVVDLPHPPAPQPRSEPAGSAGGSSLSKTEPPSPPRVPRNVEVPAPPPQVPPVLPVEASDAGEPLGVAPAVDGVGLLQGVSTGSGPVAGDGGGTGSGSGSGIGNGGGRGTGIGTAPELMRTFEPRYPAALIQQRISGRVALRVQVLRNGRAGRVEVVRPVHPRLDELASTAVRRWRWYPARDSSGRRVEAEVIVAVRFQLVD